MKYNRVLNVLVIIMMLATVLMPAVTASANYEITVVGKQFVVTGYLDWGCGQLWGRSVVNIYVNGIRIYDQVHSVSGMPGSQVITTTTYTGVIDILHVSVGCVATPRCRHPLPVGSYIRTPQIVYADIYRDGVFLEREHFAPPIPINLSHALNFTLAGAMLLPTMTIGKVDDIMMIIGRFIDCGITKFTIRAALLKAAAKGVAVVTAITAVGYLFSHFADDIYYAIFTTVPAVQPGDTHFHKDDLPQIMGIIHSYFPTKPHITKAIEQAIRLHIDAYGMISVAEVMTIVRHKQEQIVFNIYKETPEILPENINVHKDEIDEIMKIIDAYFPIEIPVRDVIEEELKEQIIYDYPNEIPIEEVYEYIEEYAGIDIDELPPAFPPYVNEITLPDIVDLIDQHYPIEIPISNIIEEELKEHIIHDYPIEIPIEMVYEYIEEYAGIDIGELPPAFPPYVNEINLPDVVDLIDQYYPIEIPIKDIIEEEIKDQIIHDYPNEIPLEEVIEIIEEEQHIYIPEFPVETPHQHEEYIRDIIDRYKEYPAYEQPYYEHIKEEGQLLDEILYYIIYDQTPCLFQEIYEIPLKPKEPKRPDEKIHTFPFYSIFVDPIANVMGIKLAHLFAAMMVVGCIISIASSWGVIGAIIGGLIGTLMTSYFGLTSWLIPLYLILVFIIYLNIKIRKGSDTR